MIKILTTSHNLFASPQTSPQKCCGNIQRSFSFSGTLNSAESVMLSGLYVGLSGRHQTVWC